MSLEEDFQSFNAAVEKAARHLKTLEASISVDAKHFMAINASAKAVQEDLNRYNAMFAKLAPVRVPPSVQIEPFSPWCRLCGADLRRSKPTSKRTIVRREVKRKIGF